MRELAEHILDIIQNSRLAGASLITINIIENLEDNAFTVEVTDNGCGMDEELLKTVLDPFMTSRNKRTGLGLSLFCHTAELAGGSLLISSKVAEGTRVVVTMKHNHINRPPLGNIVDTILVSLLNGGELVFTHKLIQTNGKQDIVTQLDTRQVRELLDDVPINAVEVVIWLKEYLNEQYRVFYTT